MVGRMTDTLPEDLTPEDLTPEDLTLDELRAAIASRIGGHAAFDGWTAAALDVAGAEIGVPAGRASLAFPGGAIDMIDAWFAHIDQAMAQRLPKDALAAMKIRDRIAALVITRLELADREALRRALVILSQPTNALRATRLGWRAADVMWRAAGDTAADFAHYTKRATLAGVYGATVLAFIDDDSDDLAETRAFLARRIDGVMRFERFKAQLKPDPDRHFSPARFLGRLRYPAR